MGILQFLLICGTQGILVSHLVTGLVQETNYQKKPGYGRGFVGLAVRSPGFAVIAAMVSHGSDIGFEEVEINH